MLKPNRRLLKKVKANGIPLLLGLLFTFSFSTNTFAQSDNNTLKGQDCVNCFHTEILNQEITDNCISVKLEVSAGDSCSSALSHITIAVPCGNISDVYNSEGWDIENPTKDPTTGLSGFKIDNISNFGEDKTAGSFIIEYTVCSNDEACLKEITDKLTIGYKAGTCISYQDIENKNTLTASLTKDDVSCYGGNNGAIYTEVNGGTPPYSFNWSNGSTLQNITGLRIGEYQVTISDSEGETIVLEEVLTQPESPITIEGIVTAASCNNNNGAIDVSVTGGTPPYSYVWTGNKTTEDIADLYAGTYLLRVFDALGCAMSASFVVTEDSNLDLTLTPNYLQCHQEGEGEITSHISGGTEPYEYIWSNNSTTANISGVNSGSYSLTVTDAMGCSVTQSTYIGISSLSLSTSVVNPTCNGGADGEISVKNVYYGTAPYTYQWDTGDTTATLSDIAAGRYRVTVTDANGCEVSRSVNLADRQALNINYSISPRNCNSDDDIEINLSGSGGLDPYQYYFNDNEISSTFNVNADGEYEITMKDALGCETTEIIVISTSETTLDVNADISQPACGGASTGAAEVIVSGGSEPYQFNWSDGATSKTRDDLSPGAYQVEVIDANGCYSSTSFTIQQANIVEASIIPPTAAINCESGALNIYANWKGSDTYTWEIIDESNSWYIEESSIDSISLFVGTGSAKLIYTVMDAEGCYATDSISLSCSIANDNTGDTDDSSDGNDHSDNDETDTPDESNFTDCFYSKITSITSTDNDGCYAFEMWVYTDGTCDHELSHFTIGLENATINPVSNSEGYPTEKNFTDPTTGLYGLKIDNISNFGQSGADHFKIEFEACFNSGILPEYLQVAYKAANGYSMQLINLFSDGNSDQGIEIKAFPNPFKDNINFTIVSKETADGELAIYNTYGEKIKSIFSGTFLANIEYTFTYQGDDINDRLLFYKLTSNKGVVQGKLLKIK
ncbi:SprB repeat-containing protein [Plebeiibacterium sediminum]|uniref:SprB repeat-containing protein n=1 Tax=Plebeiibacterium sediminum TaxID=2992112 RepID=A0AAE3M7B3_9BACT|nr:SprB repeat-containing protein [Plebeiobacterium sediminum]MCW3788438.1 SprB repeat-containing protein [Plebeiobacterium sediminum]